MLRVAAWLLSCTIAVAAASAQTSPRERTPAQVAALMEDAARYLAQCVHDWDKSTHMSQEEWTTACQRVAGERENFLREHPTARSTPEGAVNVEIR